MKFSKVIPIIALSLGILSVGIFFIISANSDDMKKEGLMENSNVLNNEEIEKIYELLSTYKDSLNSSDSELAVSLYTEDGVFMPSGAPTAEGTESIKEAYDFVFSQIQLNIEFNIEEIVIEGDVAYATSTSEGTSLIHSTNTIVPEENRELFVFKKVNGDWKISRYMFNSWN